jgi:short-subunit dehydrogenase
LSAARVGGEADRGPNLKSHALYCPRDLSEALRADLAGTGVVVTQVCPGPVESEFDTVAGSVGGMVGAPPPWLRISAAQCAREARAGFDRGQPLVSPLRATE